MDNVSDKRSESAQLLSPRLPSDNEEVCDHGEGLSIQDIGGVRAEEKEDPELQTMNNNSSVVQLQNNALISNSNLEQLGDEEEEEKINADKMEVIQDLQQN